MAMKKRNAQADRGGGLYFKDVTHLFEQSKSYGFAQRLCGERRFQSNEAIGRIRQAFVEHVQDSGRDHAANDAGAPL